MQEYKSDNETYKMVSSWLKEYRSTEDSYQKEKLRALIVTKMQSIIKRIAKTIARRDYDPVEDLVQAGSIGLLKAIDNYSFNDEASFRIYAGSLIIGEMRHYLRDKLNTIKVPRHVQELVYRINCFINTLTMEQLNDLTSDYVAEALNITSEDVDFAKQAERRGTTISLSDIFETKSGNLGFEEMYAGDDYKETASLEDTKLFLRGLIARLPDEYRRIIELYYYRDYNQKDIADTLDMTQMQVSRKLKKAFVLLYELIDDPTVEMPLFEV